MAATLRLPPDLDEMLSEHCERVGATKNRVTCIALRAYLGDEPAQRLAPDGPLAGERVGAGRLVRALAEEGLTAGEIAAATGLDLARVRAALGER